MPIYEYECKQCHHHLEVMQKISDPKLTQCPNCRADTLEKQISAAGFQLKGSGWYVTDFKNKDKPKAEPIKNTETKASGDVNV